MGTEPGRHPNPIDHLTEGFYNGVIDYNSVRAMADGEEEWRDIHET